MSGILQRLCVRHCARQESCRDIVHAGILQRHCANTVHGIVCHRFRCRHGTNTVNGTVSAIVDAISTAKCDTLYPDIHIYIIKYMEMRIT